MSSTGEDERLDMRQPFQEQLLALAKSWIAMLAENRADKRHPRCTPDELRRHS
jgi:hypothetical protein